MFVIQNPVFKKSMLLLSLLSWVLVTLMPIMNANSGVGVWAKLCTVNGIKLVQVEEGKPEVHQGKPCPFSHYSSFHHLDIFTAPVLLRSQLASPERYAFVPQRLRYQWQVPRAPPHYSFVTFT